MSPTAAGTVAEAAAGPPMKQVQDDEGAAPDMDPGATTTPADSPAGKNPADAGSGRPTPAKKAPERKPRKTRRQGLGPYRLLQPWQKEKLEESFNKCRLPLPEQKQELAKALEMDVAHLNTWLINRRTKQRRLSERMSARQAAAKAGAPGGVAGGGKVQKGKGKGPAAAAAAAAVAAAVAAGGVMKGGQGGSGSRGATENASPDATTHGLPPGPTAVYPAALQAAAHMGMVHAAQYAHLPGVAAQQAVAAAAAGGRAGVGGKVGEDVEVQSTHTTLVPIGVPPFLGGGAAPGAVPGLPGGLPYPGAVPGREWILQPGAAWGVPGAAIAPHGAAVVHDGGGGGQFLGAWRRRLLQPSGAWGGRGVVRATRRDFRTCRAGDTCRCTGSRRRLRPRRPRPSSRRRSRVHIRAWLMCQVCPSLPPGSCSCCPGIRAPGRPRPLGWEAQLPLRVSASRNLSPT